MPSWKGNPTNPVPNPVQEALARSEKRIGEDRSFPVRRDTDKQKDQRITIQDVDETIKSHLENLQITVTDEGNAVKVPIIYGSPEKWVAARRDGYLRDRQGKVQLPLIIYQRTNSENNDNLEFFNRYLKYPVIQRHSEKNKYTQFAILTGQNAPVHEVFNITMADHMIFTYKFIVWTEYTPQMNTVLEKIKFNTKDYWGSPRGFRFLCKVDPYIHTTDITVDDDRVVKTDFSLMVNGYILPESYQLLDRQYPTTEKLFTKKKIIMGIEVVEKLTDVEDQRNKDKWRSKQYPNIEAGTEPPSPQITWTDTTNLSGLSTTAQQVFTTLQVSQTTSGFSIPANVPASVIWYPAPSSPNSPGQEGWLAKDGSYIYLYTNNLWLRVPINHFS